MSMIFKNSSLKICSAFLLSVFALSPIYSFAGGTFIVSPEVLDFKLHPGESKTVEVNLKNLMKARFVTAYAFVKDIGNGFDTDDRSSLSRWIYIPRSNEIKPGGDATISLAINSNSLASVGNYHAEIYFGEGTDYEDARNRMDTSQKMIVNVEIYNDIRERLQLNSFLSKRDIYISFPAVLSYEIENVGDTDMSPTGKMIIYDNRGEQIEERSIIDEPFLLKPKEKKKMEFILNQPEAKGKYKAFLTIDYGKASLHDSVSFTVLPTKKIGLIFLVAIIILLFLINLFYKFYERSKE